MADFHSAHFIEVSVCTAIRRILGLRCDRIDLTMRLVEDLRCESIDLVEIPMAIEDRFAIEITDDEAEACRTVADYTVLVRAKLAGRFPVRTEIGERG